MMTFGGLKIGAAMVVLASSMAVMAQLPEVVNGDMSAGGETPSGWTLKADEGQMALVRDTADFASAPASLRLEAVGGKAKGNASQRLELVPGQTFAVTGKVRAAGQVGYAAVVMLVPGAKTPWNPLTSFATATAWDAFSAKFTVPADATWGLLMVFMDGEGQVWLDDVAIAEPAAAAATSVIEDFNRGPDFAYSDFAQAAAVARDGALHIKAPAGRGGAARNVDLDLGAFADHTPVLWLKTGAGNRAKQIRVFIEDAAKVRRNFTYSLSGIGADAFTMVVPEGAAPLRADDASFDVAAVRMFQIQGAWNNDPVEVVVDRIELVAPDAAMLAERAKAAERQAEAARQQARAAAERAEQVRRMIAEGVPHPEDGPEVTGICAVAPDMLAVTIQAQRVVHAGPEPYVPVEGDEIRPGKSRVPAWERGTVVEAPVDRNLHRPSGGGKPKHGAYFEPYGDWTPMVWRETMTGQPLTVATVDEPQAYRIASADDPAFAAAVVPVAVHRKSKPTDQDMTGGGKAVRHVVYLKLPAPLKDGATYTVAFRAINTRQESATYRHAPRELRSEAVHASHIGYRPDDPFKRAYLSLWLGTGGAMAYAAPEFELLDDRTGETVHRGQVVAGFPADRPEKLKVEKNFNFTDVYYLDFHDFATPGTYRVHVPGIGCSAPFPIADDAWTAPFRASLHGLLSHRSGIELGPPFTEYRRPRNMHPADGVKVFAMTRTRLEGESDTVESEIREQLGNPPDISRLKEYPDAWGGYMDAGDWDRRSQHLVVTRDLLELYRLFPEHFAQVKLALPPAEANDRIPDLVNECLWNIDGYRRLQRPDGGVGGGIESTAHPRPGEASWQETLLIGTFAPDPVSSLLLAATAAQAAGILADVGEASATAYRDSAVRAWDWAEAHAERVLAEVAARSPNAKMEAVRSELRGARLMAAVALFRLTGEARFHDAFRQSFAALNHGNISNEEMGALFAYALLPPEQAEPAIREQAMAEVIRAADVALEFGTGNAFSLHTRAPGVPMMGYLGYYSVPEMITGPVLPRAYFLTGDEKYLRAAVAAANFSAGANPVNITFTTGVGHDWPRAPLHIDSRVTGQAPPHGITVYGPMDAGADFGFNGWVHQWHLGDMVPPSREWPASEWYVDLYLWPAMNEYTVHQSFRPTAYYWGFLGARPQIR